jgi:hypothetical protein
METGAFVPLAFFALVVLIVAITTLAKIRDKEMEVHQTLHFEEMEHRRKMAALEAELERARRQGSQRDATTFKEAP